jgi:quercetin dioxygenase-like cupin family protein
VCIGARAKPNTDVKKRGEKSMRWSFFALCAAATLGGYGISRIEQAQSATPVATKPLIVEKNHGELRVRRPRETPMPTAAFTIKVDPQNGGSQHLVVGTETIPPGGQIARHKHLGQDEIVLVETGSAHVWLASEERDVQAGAVVFIPSDTWIGLKNTGNENISLTFVFSAPGFEEFQRCISVPAGRPARPLGREEFLACQHQGHIAFEAVAPRADSK